MADNLNQAVRRWMFEDALPFWSEHGVDRAFGGYVEQLRLDGSDAGVGFKRVRVTCRQIYVFSHAALLGYRDGIALARHGYEFLTSKAWQGPDGGWARSVDREGCTITDGVPDLYDHAFVLFGLGWLYRVTKDPEVLKWAVRTLDFLNAHMRHRSGHGYLTQVPASVYRRQNPHMHLLEAALVNVEATGDARFQALADEMVALFSDHFYDSRTRTLREYFNEDWSPAPGDAGHVTEPGHQFEWAWLLAGYQHATGRDMRDYMRGLVAFAETHGVDQASGATFNAVRSDGIALDRKSLVWPNTERIQAAVAMFELDGRDPRPIFEQSGRLLLSRYLSHAPRGTWMNEFGPNGTPQADRIPASTFYHLFLAFAEMLRVEETVARSFAGGRNCQ
jgi:mannose/cellobiose epimerase-like protein (N-acyl-D-glucosamine 2-epimerase family)